MVKFYRLDKQEVIDTVTDIPVEQWEKKQVLPYELNIVSIAEGEETNIVEGLDFQDDKVVETKIQSFHIPTLEELKEQKYYNLKNNVRMYVNTYCPDYKQLSALSTLTKPDNAPYSIEEAEYIQNFCKIHVDEVRRLKNLITNSTTEEELESIPETVEFVWGE